MPNMNKQISDYIKNNGNPNIIGAGEATHGQSKITEARVSLFKYLVKYNRFTVFVLEDNYSCCELINNYIRGSDKYKIKKLITHLMDPWRSHHLLNLMKWMRRYNTRNGNILEFKGVDSLTKCFLYSRVNQRQHNHTGI